jgi:hypothetical protein
MLAGKKGERTALHHASLGNHVARTQDQQTKDQPGRINPELTAAEAKLKTQSRTNLGLMGKRMQRRQNPAACAASQEASVHNLWGGMGRATDPAGTRVCGV